MSEKLSNQIYKSRDEIKSQIIDYMRSYLEIENADLTKSSFLSFMVNTFATLTSNILFYQSSVYREFFLTKAQMKESVYDLASFLGYQPERASYAEVDCLITIPLEFSDDDVTFEFPIGYKAKAGDITFTTDYKTIVNVKNNSSVTVTIEEENTSYNIPVKQEDGEFFFILTLKQYSANEQEFQIDEDLNLYQFVNIDVPISGSVSEIRVFVKPPDSTELEEYESTNSLFLLSNDDRGFVDRQSEEGIRLYFGNGLIGYQPEPGSTVIVETSETEGSDGNVIPGSITNGDRIYVSDEGTRKILNYDITNTSSATGGSDEESLEEIRSNAINSLTSMNRLVSRKDYDNFETVTETGTIENSLPVLKRSDLKINEIQIYTTLTYNDDLVPTRNEILQTEDTHISRGTIIEKDEENYIVPFDLTIDDINKVANYDYIVDKLSVTPKLITTYDKQYNFISDELIVYKDENFAVFELSYTSTEENYDELESKMRILNMGESYDLVNDSDNNIFKIQIDYKDLSDGELDLNFDIESPDGLVSSYSGSVIFKRKLRDLMISNVSMDSTNDIEIYTIYDVPVIEQSYYNDVDKENFEIEVLQKIVGLNLEDYRMLTDFNNIKFSNTVGKTSNMLNNVTSLKSVKEIISELPEDPSTNDRYILESSGDIALFDGEDWLISRPTNSAIIYVDDLGYKLVYSEGAWIKPIYDLPLNIEVEVFTQKNFTGSEVSLIDDIKDSLVSSFSERFGLDAELYKSEIIDVIHSVDGVGHCHVLKPKTNIFFNYTTDDLDRQELLEYSPEYIYFTKDTISIRLY